jgi:hypothetical protein
MSKGNSTVRARIPPDLENRILLQIAKRNLHSRLQPWTLSDWVRVACEEKLSKMERCRRPRSRKAGAVSLPLAGENANS